jgi:hypothetical protein
MCLCFMYILWTVFLCFFYVTIVCGSGVSNALLMHFTIAMIHVGYTCSGQNSFAVDSNYGY